MAGETFPTSSSIHPKLYRIDGGAPLDGIAVMGLCGLAAATGLGVIQGLLWSVKFNILILSPCLIGLALGYFLSFGVKRGKVRSRLICAIIAILCACVVGLCLHLFQFVVFERSMAAVPSNVRSIARDFAQLYAHRNEQSDEVQNLLDEMVRQPAVRESLAVNGFFDYVDMMARRGMTITDAKKPGRAPENLGYRGTYAYWIAEILMIFGITYGFAASQASQPFCVPCESWKLPNISGFVMGGPVTVKKFSLSGDLAVFGSARERERKENLLKVTVLACPDCGSPDQIEVRLESTIHHMDWHGKSSAKPQSVLCTVSCPGDAANSIGTLLQTPQGEETAKQCIGESEAGFGRSLLVYGWVVLTVAGLVLCVTLLSFFYVKKFSPFGGILLSLIIAGCGWGLRFIGLREIKRH